MRNLPFRSLAALALALPVTACGAARAMPSTTPAPSGLMAPDSAALSQPAPPSFQVLFETTKGDFVVEAYREWAPRGVDRFYHLTRLGYYDGASFFRNVPGFVVQFGLHGDPAVTAAWREARFPDDSVRASNVRGTLTFAIRGPDTRTVQLFINLRDNVALDAQGFAPFARVVGGMDVVDSLYSGYGDAPPRGRGPDQTRIQAEGDAYLRAEFPLLDAIIRAAILVVPAPAARD